MKFELLVLGANSATPVPGRFPSSFVLNHEEHLYLIDCGEGSQIKMSEYHVKRSRIDHIFISHLHGDHIFGLPGFLNSYSLNRREKPLHIYGPVGLRDFISTCFRVTGNPVHYELHIHELQAEQVHDLGLIDRLSVTAFPLRHRIPTFGYRFTEVHLEYNIDPAAIKKYNLSIDEILAAKKGQDIVRSENYLIKNQDLVLPPKPARSFAYVSDTVYHPPIVEHVQDVNLIYHEATYMHNMAEQARDRMHATTIEAAMIAEQAGAQALAIGHYSSRYKELSGYLAEAQLTFQNTHLALSGSRIEIPQCEL